MRNLQCLFKKITFTRLPNYKYRGTGLFNLWCQSSDKPQHFLPVS